MAAFADFHVAATDKRELQDIFQTAVKLGFDHLAVSVFVHDLKGKGKKQQQPTICRPELVTLNDQTTSLLKVEGRQMKQFARITALLDDITNTHKLSSPEFQNFDLLAVQPTNETAFKQACITLEVDIIVLNMTEKLPFYIKRPLVHRAMERGIHFEILYSPAVRDSTLRQNIISNALQLTSACKGKNIIISSGCEKAIELRGPYDISNLGLLFGLSSPQSKDSVSKNCRALLKHAEARKIMKSVVGVIKSSEISPEDKWILCSRQGESETQDETPPAKKAKTSNCKM